MGIRIQLLEDFRYGGEFLGKGFKCFAEETWEKYNKPVYGIKRGAYKGVCVPREICKEIEWDDYSKEEKREELKERMEGKFDKITYHQRQEAHYRTEVTTILQELEELNKL